MKLRLFGPGGRVWRLAFRIKHTAKSLKYRQLYNIRGGHNQIVNRRHCCPMLPLINSLWCRKSKNILYFSY